MVPIGEKTTPSQLYFDTGKLDEFVLEDDIVIVRYNSIMAGRTGALEWVTVDTRGTVPC